MRREGASVIRIISVLQNDYARTDLRPGSLPRRKDSVSWRASKAEAATVALRTDLNHTRGGGQP